MGTKTDIGTEIKRGSAELAILAVLESGSLHGYEIAKRIEQTTHGVLRFDVASLYPLLYRLEKKKWIQGAWESNGARKRRCYQLTPQGKKRLVPLREQWRMFFQALNRLAGVSNA